MAKTAGLLSRNAQHTAIRISNCGTAKGADCEGVLPRNVSAQRRVEDAGPLGPPPAAYLSLNLYTRVSAYSMLIAGFLYLITAVDARRVDGGETTPTSSPKSAICKCPSRYVVRVVFVVTVVDSDTSRSPGGAAVGSALMAVSLFPTYVKKCGERALSVGEGAHIGAPYTPRDTVASRPAKAKPHSYHCVRRVGFFVSRARKNLEGRQVRRSAILRQGARQPRKAARARFL